MMLDILVENCLKFSKRFYSDYPLSLISFKHFGHILPLIFPFNNFLTLIFSISSCFYKLILNVR